MTRFLLPVALLLAGCSYFQKQPVTVSEQPLAVQEAVDLTRFDSAAIGYFPLVARMQVTRFYRGNGFHFVWKDTAGTLPRGDSMVNIIRNARTYGLNPDDYHLNKIEVLLQLPGTPDRSAQLDLYLTDGFFSMHHHLKNGRISNRTLQRIPLDTIADDISLTALQQALNKNAVAGELAKQEPEHEQYYLLKAELKKMLAGTNDKITQERIDKLMVNMERWRWQKKGLPDRYVAVNTPSFMLKVVENDSVMLESRVIVGKAQTPTPELSSVIKTFTIYPYWHVPRSIVKEILPRIQKDTMYMARHNYQVLDGAGKVIDPGTLDWDSFDEKNFPYTLRQREGNENTMGVIKFVFANNYNVYLHDTNARGLFSRANRALSHGCVRVQKAVQLAHYLAKDDDTYVGPEDLDQYLEVQHRMNVDVVKPIPVLLQYYTAFAGKDGVKFFDDIYGKDREILNAWFHVTLHATDESEPVNF